MTDNELAREIRDGNQLAREAWQYGPVPQRRLRAKGNRFYIDNVKASFTEVKEKS